MFSLLQAEEPKRATSAKIRKPNPTKPQEGQGLNFLFYKKGKGNGIFLFQSRFGKEE